MNLCRLFKRFSLRLNLPFDTPLSFVTPDFLPAHTVKKSVSLTCLFLITGMFLFAGGNALAATTEDVVEGAGELSKFGIDVLEDFGLEGKTSEESGKARLEDLLKGKTKDYIKDKLTGGSDLSEGMGLILNKIFDGVNTYKGKNACELAALNQAYGITFDAKNTRLLRGAANIWFDVLTSIPGAPALAEKLVTETGKFAYSKLRSELEGKIKDWWASQKDESFKLTKQSGPCSITLTVLWNKKKNKYLFLITGKCDCKTVAIEPLGRGGTIAMKSFQIIGGGSITPKPDLSDPNKPKVKLSVGSRVDIKISADCNCAAGETWLPPPDDPIHISPATRMELRVLEAKCKACEPLLKTVKEYVKEFNAIADQMDELAKKINKEPKKTPERDANVEKWNDLSKQQSKVEKLHDQAYDAFAKCEEEECKLGTGAVWLDELSTLREQWTDCKECIPIMEAVNKLIGDYNKQVEVLNGIASSARRAKLKLGTVEGNKAYREWHKLRPALDPLNASIQQKIAELSACKAKYCSGTRWQTWVKTRPISGTCTPCISFQEKYNEAAKEYNKVIDKLNDLQKKQKEYIEKFGDSGAGQAGYEELLQKEDLHGLLKAEKEGREKLDRIKAELDACVKEKCSKVEIIDTKVRIGNDPYDPRDPIAENSENIEVGGSGGSGATVKVINNIPISRLSLSGADVGCPNPNGNHYHGSANNCNGVFTMDPDSSGCGQGRAINVISIPVSSCPDL